jgi:hypothetical protein
VAFGSLFFNVERLSQKTRDMPRWMHPAQSTNIAADLNTGAADSQEWVIREAVFQRRDGIRTAENGRIPSPNRSFSGF